MKIINTIGLVFDIIGALMMFFNTPHPSSKPKAGDIINESADWLMGGRQKEARQIKLVRVGLGLLVVGFAFQLIANFF